MSASNGPEMLKGDQQQRDPVRVTRVLGRVTGLGLLLSAPACGLLGWLALSLLAGLAADPPYPPNEIPALVARCVAFRAAVPVLALPALLCGAILLRRPRRPWLLSVFGSLSLLIPVVVVLYCFVMLVAPMYRYRPL